LIALVDGHPVKPWAIVPREFAARVDHPYTAPGINEVHVPAAIHDNSRAGVSDTGYRYARDNQKRGNKTAQAHKLLVFYFTIPNWPRMKA
jgi:hypothetical protein